MLKVFLLAIVLGGCTVHTYQVPYQGYYGYTYQPVPVYQYQYVNYYRPRAYGHAVYAPARPATRPGRVVARPARVRAIRMVKR